MGGTTAPGANPRPGSGVLRADPTRGSGVSKSDPDDPTAGGCGVLNPASTGTHAPGVDAAADGKHGVGGHGDANDAIVSPDDHCQYSHSAAPCARLTHPRSEI